MNSYKLQPGEKFVGLYPIGIAYDCPNEGCHGEMKVHAPSGEDPQVMNESLNRIMIKHRCTKCGQDLELAKAYPYIEWSPIPNGKLMIENHN